MPELERGFYIVGTPIGNLEDITLRALKVLRNVDLIACEDTRHTSILMRRYNLHTPLISYYSYNKIQRARYLIDLLRRGKKIALVSDAGMPGIADPGYYIIKLVRENNIPLSIVPGPCALNCALILSGTKADNFLFEGFLPVRSPARKNRLAKILQLSYPIVIYEAPHRLIRTLRDIEEISPGLEIAVVREITKKFEEIAVGRPDYLIGHFSKQGVRGEFVLVIPYRGK